jgi:hypothetical protein
MYMSKSIKREYPGYTVWENEQGQTHREDSPAVERKDGSKQWWINGKRHRLDGPAIEWTEGKMFWYVYDSHIKIY